MSFYWGRTLGRAAEEAKPVFEATEAFNHARHPKTGRRSNWNDFQGWIIPAQNNPYIDEVKQALTYQQTSKEWLVKYCHSLMPNVAPVYKDVADSAELKNHPFYSSKPRTVDTYFKTSLEHSSSTANEMLKGVNPLAGFVHGRSVLAQTVQKVVIDKHGPSRGGQVGSPGARYDPQGKHASHRLSRSSARLPEVGMATRFRRFTLSDQAVGVLFMVPFVLTALFFMVYPIVEAFGWPSSATIRYVPTCPPSSACPTSRISSTTSCSGLLFGKRPFGRAFRLSFQTLFGVAIAMLATPGIAGHLDVPRPAVVPVYRPDGSDRPHLALDFNPEIGVVNYALLGSGVIAEPIYWLSTPEMAMASTIMLNVWKYTPFVVICVLARLQTVPLELYDAAKVDGAGVFRRFADVTLPQLKEVLIVVMVFRTIWTFNKFEEIYLLTKGGPGTSTFNLAVYAFEQSIANLELGVGAATGVVMMIMLSVGSVIYLRVPGSLARKGTR